MTDRDPHDRSVPDSWKTQLGRFDRRLGVSRTGSHLPRAQPDPFGGTGTTAVVAKALGRTGVTVDMSGDYCRLAAWRTTNPDQLAKAAGVKRSDQARAADGLDMDALFDLDGGAA